MTEVTAEIEAGGQGAGAGLAHRVARAVQKRFFEPSQALADKKGIDAIL